LISRSAPWYACVGDDAGLAAGERERRDAEVCQCHAQESHRNSLAGAEQHVELSTWPHTADILGEPMSPSVVLPIALTTTMSRCRSAGPSDVIGDGADAVRVADEVPPYF